MNTMRQFRILGLVIAMLAGVSISNSTKAQPGARMSFQSFYNDLSPYGRWINTPEYGSVWQPDVDQDFQPYSTNGYWEVTEYGNTWVSDYDWGWAPFHYGRWSFNDYNGWFWIPGYEWGPAWVNWRSGGGYYGWAPLGPGMNINISVNIPSFWWVFVPQRYISSPRWRSYCAPRNQVSRYYSRTTIINNYYRNDNRTYVYGPRRDEIERVTRRSVQVRDIDSSPRGRGRVIVAENSRGNDRYDGSASGRNSRSDNSNRRGSTIDVSGDRGNRSNSDVYERGSDRSGSSRVEANPGVENRRSDPSYGRSDNNVPADRSDSRSNERFNRDRSSVPSPSESRGNRSYESPRPTAPERVESRPDYGSERSNRSNRSNESAYPSQGRTSSDSPSPRASRSDRGSSESRGSSQGNRSSDNSGRGSGSSERSSRSPR